LFVCLLIDSLIELDCCNSLYFNLLPNPLINRLQYIQNYLVRTLVKASKIYHVTPVLNSIHWLKSTDTLN